MAFEILPAIDVAGDRLVSASAGKVQPIDAFGGSPLAAAEAFVEAGARWLHVVDVERARGGPSDLTLLRRIADVGARVQASGGIERRSAAADVLEAGAERVVLGSGILLDRAATVDAVHGLRGRVVVGLEADGHVLRPRSRSSAACELPLAETLAWVRTLGCDRYLYTGVSRVAGLGGPDLDGVRAAARVLGAPVLVAGGIGSIDHVVAIRSLGADVAVGCVVGRALYEGLELRSVLAAVRSL